MSIYKSIFKEIQLDTMLWAWDHSSYEMWEARRSSDGRESPHVSSVELDNDLYLDNVGLSCREDNGLNIIVDALHGWRGQETYLKHTWTGSGSDEREKGMSAFITNIFFYCWLFGLYFIVKDISISWILAHTKRSVNNFCLHKSSHI